MGQQVQCCKSNHIGRCLPGSEDDAKCDKLCHGSCYKGGQCKVEGSKPPNHFCHCYC